MLPETIAAVPDEHGGPDAQGVPIHDFSTNSNACGPCPDALMVVQQADAAHYPDPAYDALRRRLGAFHGVPVRRIVFAASASEFIFRITAAVARRGGRAVHLPNHGYGDYAKAALAWGLQALRGDAAAGDAQLVWCCDPSSPLGRAQPGLGEQLDALVPEAVCVLDLAYEPLRLQGHLALRAGQRDRVWQLWTPNKALGLAGIRAAYAIAPAGPVGSALQAQVERLAPSWPLGAHGAALLDAWTTDRVQRWLAQSRETLRLWKAHQQALLRDELGWTCLPSEANFFCARPVLSYRMTLQQSLAGLRAHGIKLRDCASFGLPGHVRVSVQPPAAQAALHNSWQQLTRAGR
ncbi:MAG: aminotransferase class I/II-fold pyridoxal phosphate-dependent enzyme [Burkholderiaceae bacterium]|nr:MAG: aminotransferase class I/II-fold pyridoxal phosphate-dependent enzyme [Burkholderiaceae bacterium]TBR73764.1 MAG: aminotransferase class I/II-fold pyridoxal phosphate-dependent enzyme [Burkholderiaceae bacterium]